MSRYCVHEEEHDCKDGVRRKILIEADDDAGHLNPLEDNAWGGFEDDFCEFVTPKGMRATYGHKQVDRDWLRPVRDGWYEDVIHLSTALEPYRVPGQWPDPVCDGSRKLSEIVGDMLRIADTIDDEVVKAIALRLRGEYPTIIPYINGTKDGYHENKNPILVLPVAKYEHSGVMLFIGTRGPDFPWDSGQIGWIWMDASGWEKVEGEPWVETPENLARAEELLTSVIKTYSHWVSGEVWGYRIEKLVACDPICKCGRDPTWENDDGYSGCSGYIGEWDECGVLEDARSELGVEEPAKAA